MYFIRESESNDHASPAVTLSDLYSEKRKFGFSTRRNSVGWFFIQVSYYVNIRPISVCNIDPIIVLNIKLIFCTTIVRIFFINIQPILVNDIDSICNTDVLFRS